MTKSSGFEENFIQSLYTCTFRGLPIREKKKKKEVEELYFYIFIQNGVMKKLG